MRIRRLRAPRHSMLYLCLLAGFASAQAPQLPGQQKPLSEPAAPASGSNFNEEFLRMGGDQPHADLSLFAFGNQVMPGEYVVDVMVNQNAFGKSSVRFDAKEGKRDAVPCLTRELLDSWGVNVQVFPAIVGASADACIDLPAVIPDAAVSFVADKQRLNVSIPQAAFRRSARGAVDPSKWDQGITAAMLDYQLNYARYSGGGLVNPYSAAAQQQSAFDNPAFGAPPKELDRNTFYAGFRLGANLGEWRFRQFSNYNQTADGNGRWQAINTYVQRDVQSIRGQLLIGDGTTPGNFFDSMQFRGVQISSDDAMLPDSQQGYAPTIRGVAQTNARVTVRQNGYIIYSTFVAPGPFVIDDLYPTASSGDLEVTITEADGRQTRYTQAFSAVPTLLREGTWRYSATGGKYRNGYGSGFTYSTGNASYGYGSPVNQPSEPGFVQGTLARGLGDDYTLYGGFMGANMYQALLAGVGKNLKEFGAVSIDLSAAHTTVDSINQSYNGQSLRFLYAKSFIDLGTSFRMAGYRYSTSGYRTFPEAVQMQALQPDSPFNSRRSEVRFDLSQQLFDWGSVFASARQQSYWGTDRNDRLVQLGYTGNYKQLTYSIFYNYSTNLYAPSNRQISVSLSIPLGDTRANAQYSATSGSNGLVNQQASVYGSTFDDSRLTYNVTAGHSNQTGENGSASASYLSQVGRLDAGYSGGRNYGQTTLGVAGGVVVHGGGVTLSQPLGETIALVEAPKAAGVGFDSQPGVATDWAGNAVIPNLTPYRTNRLAMRTSDLGDTVEVKNAATEMVPTRGAVVFAKFDTSVGYRLMMTLTGFKGEVLPFGARIEDAWGREMGIVGPDGQAFVSGAEAAARLNVIWGQGPGERCTVAYSLPDVDKPPPIREVSVQCVADVAAHLRRTP
ncbi:fimbria/pilus outer membrane usher protein [Variovorax sp. OV329]|uniref:fimbria/pilus outer membrane usher protein n=1 Tax=Variovorax sp. OV329 TaxID=1882825 RepID=UPI0008E82686|nr:fimbria/pilus outer membrane usher protein [Variovorax sp. OV329]SFM97180.1 outer membrane usher protein [Variovorax sp. OV329]